MPLASLCVPPAYCAAIRPTPLLCTAQPLAVLPGSCTALGDCRGTGEAWAVFGEELRVSTVPCFMQCDCSVTRSCRGRCISQPRAVQYTFGSTPLVIICTLGPPHCPSHVLSSCFYRKQLLYDDPAVNVCHSTTRLCVGGISVASTHPPTLGLCPHTPGRCPAVHCQKPASRRSGGCER